jgi:hypothetical protein
LRLADILAALRQLDQEDQPPRPRGGAAIRVSPSTSVSAVGAAAEPAAPARDIRPFRIAAPRERFPALPTYGGIASCSRPGLPIRNAGSWSGGWPRS